MGYRNITEQPIDSLAWEKANYPLTYQYLTLNHPRINRVDIPCILNTYLGPKGLRVILNGESDHETCIDVEHFLRETMADNKEKRMV